jgi:hypothetical protein
MSTFAAHNESHANRRNQASAFAAGKITWRIQGGSQDEQQGKTSMFRIMFNTAPRRQRGALKRPGLFSRLSEAVDAYAKHRMQMAVPEFEQLRAEHEITRYRQQMRRIA